MTLLCHSVVQAKFMAFWHSLIDSSNEDLIYIYSEHLIDSCSGNFIESYSEADEATENE